ncbi:MAG TPA: energy transducer TonB [Flavobacteriales bacterium]|nr:energy transducer TonB [Flavobacteriales bacterium]
MKKFVVLCFSCFSLFGKAQTDKVYEAHELQQSAEFLGGIKALYKYLKENICYPETGKRDKIEGKVYVDFVIDKDGKPMSARVKKGLRTDFDTICLGAFDFMPKWKPGLLDGKAVKQHFTVPFNFVLNKDGSSHIDFTPVSCADLQKKRSKLRKEKKKK